jgi:uncharacterized protein (DUF1015 family)
MPTVSPFRALRYDETVAGPLDRLVAPPYDVIGNDALYALWHASDHNIVHLTLPDSPEQAAADLAAWRDAGVLREEEPALWWVRQEFAGADGAIRVREGIAGSIEATPYAERQVLRHEETHAKPKEERLAILRATRTQLEPIFLLYDADPLLEAPGGEPLMQVEEGGVRTSVWRVDSGPLELDEPLLIADGHHRYETAVNFRAEEPAATHTFAVLVSSRSSGVEILPTHRIVKDVGIQPSGLMTSTWDTGSLAVYQDGNFYRLDSDDELDTRELDRYEPLGIEYTPDPQHAIEAVDSGLGSLAFLVRAPSVEQVFAFGLRGETMPPKTTFFYPKLTSGLLLHPVLAG